MERRLKIASWILVGLLLLPLFQHTTGLVHMPKLKGAVKTAPVPRLSAQGWFEGTCQDSLERAWKDRFGFRNLFIRVNNQVAFSLYRKALANGVVIGKKNYLYESNYIHARNGDDYIGDSLILERSRKLKEIQEYCTERGKQLVVTFAAGKGSYYPEYFPERFQKEPGKTNIRGYSECFDSLGVHYIDFNKWFVEMKDTSKYCLYPKTGVHWSYYGMVLVIDSLTNYVGEATGREMTDFEFGNIGLSRKYQSSDRDIEEAMNIIFRINYDRMAYPEVRFVEKEAAKPRGIIISDSFYWGLHNMGFSHRILGDSEFWYYFKQVYTVNPGGVSDISEINPLEHIDSADIVILMATEATVARFPYGFEDILAD